MDYAYEVKIILLVVILTLLLVVSFKLNKLNEKNPAKENTVDSYRNQLPVWNEWQCSQCMVRRDWIIQQDKEFKDKNCNQTDKGLEVDCEGRDCCDRGDKH